MRRPSPFLYRLRRRTEPIYREGGWGPKLSWRIPRSTGDPLFFELRVPIGVELIDVAKLAEHADGKSAFLEPAMEALRRVVEASGTVLTAAVCNVPTEAAPREVLATLTAGFAEVAGPPDPERFAIDDSEDAVRSHQVVKKLSEKLTLVTRMSAHSLGEGQDPVPVMTQQYLVETGYGALAIAFSTTRGDMMGDWAARLYSDIAGLAFIGERPKPY